MIGGYLCFFCNGFYFVGALDRIHLTKARVSSSRIAFGGMGFAPQMLLPPLLTFSASIDAAPVSLSYFTAIP
jgi:hypothetical protein